MHPRIVEHVRTSIWNRSVPFFGCSYEREKRRRAEDDLASEGQIMVSILIDAPSAVASTSITLPF